MMNNSETLHEDNTIRISNKYTYYNYMKKHKGQCLTVFSFIAVLLTFVSNALQYYSEIQLFKKWNIDISFLNMPNDSSFLFSLTYYIVLTLVIVIIISKSVVCFKRYFTLKCELNLLFAINRFSERLDQENEELYKAISTDNTFFDDESKNDSVKSEKTVLLQSRKRLRRLLWYYRFQLLCDFLLFFIVICCLLYVGKLFSVDSEVHAVMYALINSSVIFVTQYIATFFDYYHSLNSEVKELFIASINNPLSLEQVFEDLENNYKELKKQRSSFLKFSDDEIKKAAASFVLTLGCLLVVFFVYTNNSSNDNFNVIKTEDEQFVVVFDDGSDYFLKPATIEDDSIEIYLSETVITSERISIQRRQFETIKILNK